MFAENGKQNRLSRLGLPQAINLVALDHGLSLGWTESQDDPVEVAESCRTLGLQGVICHSGLLSKIRRSVGFEVILQLHGSTSADSAKVPIARPHHAIEADCVGVAVEFQSSGPSSALAATAQLVQDAHALGLLVLVMANYIGEDFFSATTALVGAGQLGADVVKLRLPATRPSPMEIDTLRRVVDASVPVLVAGGNVSLSLPDTLRLAADVGCVGSCIGRNYFDATNRSLAVDLSKNTFPREGTFQSTKEL